MKEKDFIKDFFENAQKLNLIVGDEINIKISLR